MTNSLQAKLRHEAGLSLSLSILQLSLNPQAKQIKLSCKVRPEGAIIPNSIRPEKYKDIEWHTYTEVPAVRFSFHIQASCIMKARNKQNPKSGHDNNIRKHIP